MVLGMYFPLTNIMFFGAGKSMTNFEFLPVLGDGILVENLGD